MLLSSLTYGQHRWKGEVQDQNGKGISEVVLSSNKTGELGATDREGNFNIILPKLPFVVYSSKVGYITDTLLVVDEMPVNIVLKKQRSNWKRLWSIATDSSSYPVNVQQVLLNN